MGVRNKKSNDLFFGIMQSPQATLPKETLLMDIILYLLQFIQYHILSAGLELERPYLLLPATLPQDHSPYISSS